MPNAVVPKTLCESVACAPESQSPSRLRETRLAPSDPDPPRAARGRTIAPTGRARTRSQVAPSRAARRPGHAQRSAAHRTATASRDGAAASPGEPVTHCSNTAVVRRARLETRFARDCAERAAASFRFVRRRAAQKLALALELRWCSLAGFGLIEQLQLVADLSQQIFPPRNVGVGFDTQRRG